MICTSAFVLTELPKTPHNLSYLLKYSPCNPASFFSITLYFSPFLSLSLSPSLSPSPSFTLPLSLTKSPPPSTREGRLFREFQLIAHVPANDTETKSLWIRQNEGVTPYQLFSMYQSVHAQIFSIKEGLLFPSCAYNPFTILECPMQLQ